VIVPRASFSLSIGGNEPFAALITEAHLQPMARTRINDSVTAPKGFAPIEE